jgi:hypothetical protein
MDYCTNFHPIIGGGVRTAMQMLLMMAGTQYSTPASRAWITFACAIGIDCDVRFAHDVFIPVLSFVDWHFGQQD